MSERPKVQHSKCCVVSQPPWVQIPALPPLPPGPIGAGRFCYARKGVSACECCLLLLVAPLVFRAPEAPAAVCAGGRRPARESSAPRAAHAACWCLWRRWCFGRRRARPPARSPHASFARSGRSRSPPVPSGPSGALHTGGTYVAEVWTGASSRSPAGPRVSKHALSSVSHAIP